MRFSVAILVAAAIQDQGIIGTLAWTAARKASPSRSGPFQQQRRSPKVVVDQSTDHPDEQNGAPAFSSHSRRQLLAGVVGAATAGTSLAVCSQPALAATATKAIVPTASLCDPTVSIWERNGRTIYLLGTAHISEKSAELAGQLVRDSHPDAVFVELDFKRIGGTSKMAQRMEENEREGRSSMSIASSAEGDGETKATRVMISPVGRRPAGASGIEPSSVSASTALATTTPTVTSTVVELPSSPATEAPPALVPAESPRPKQTSNKNTGDGGGFFQNLGAKAVGSGIRGLYSKLGNEGFNPGEEFVVAIREGQKQGAAVVLGDQDVDVTLRQMAKALRQTDLKRLTNPDGALEQSMRDMVVPPSSSNDAFKSELSSYVETIKTKDNVKQIMNLMKQEAPALYQVMVSERDAYMSAGLNMLDEFAVITAVMGLAHVDGVENNLRKEGWRAVPLRCPTKA